MSFVTKGGIKMIELEFTCTANEERSASAEAIAIDYITENGLNNIVSVYSSGTHVDRLAGVIGRRDLTDTSIGLSVKRTIIKKALNNGVLGWESAKDDYGVGVEADATEVLETLGDATGYDGFDDATLETVNGLYVTAKKVFTPHSESELERALGQYGVKFKPKKANQFKPRKGVTVSFGMADGKTTAIKEAYEGRDDSPQEIVTLNRYVGMDPTDPVVMQTDPAKFDTFAGYMVKAVPDAVEKAVEQYTKQNDGCKHDPTK